jgi:hypothetical protein
MQLVAHRQLGQVHDMITINGCDPLDRGRCAAIIGYKPKDAAHS